MFLWGIVWVGGMAAAAFWYVWCDREEKNRIIAAVDRCDSANAEAIVSMRTELVELDMRVMQLEHAKTTTKKPRRKGAK